MIIPDDFVLLSSRLWLALKMQLVKGLKAQNCRGLEGELYYFLLNQCRIVGEFFVLISLYDVPLIPAMEQIKNLVNPTLI